MQRELLRELLQRWADSFSRLARARSGGPALDSLWSYLLQVVDFPVRDLIDLVEETMDSHVVRKFKSPAQQLIEIGQERGRLEGREEGLEQGRQAGRELGVLEGRRELLLRQLEVRFGPLPRRVCDAVAAAHAGQLDDLAVRLLDSDTLDSLFPAS